MLTRFGFAETTFGLIIHKPFFMLSTIQGGAVAVNATSGMPGKKALTELNSLKSFLNSSPLEVKGFLVSDYLILILI